VLSNVFPVCMSIIHVLCVCVCVYVCVCVCVLRGGRGDVVCVLPTHQESVEKLNVGEGERGGTAGKLPGNMDDENVKTKKRHDCGVVLVPPSKGVKLRMMVLPQR